MKHHNLLLLDIHLESPHHHSSFLQILLEAKIEISYRRWKKARVPPLQNEVVNFQRMARMSAADISGTLMSVLFNPDDLSMIKGMHRIAEKNLMTSGRQANKSYSRSSRHIPRQLSKEISLNLIGQMKNLSFDAWDFSFARGEGLRFFMHEFIVDQAWQRRHVRSTRTLWWRTRK